MTSRSSKDQKAWVCSKYGLRSSRINCSDWSSRWLDSSSRGRKMRLTATFTPPGASARKTSPNAPLPMRLNSLYPSLTGSTCETARKDILVATVGRGAPPTVCCDELVPGEWADGAVVGGDDPLCTDGLRGLRYSGNGASAVGGGGA